MDWRALEVHVSAYAAYERGDYQRVHQLVDGRNTDEYVKMEMDIIRYRVESNDASPRERRPAKLPNKGPTRFDPSSARRRRWPRRRLAYMVTRLLTSGFNGMTLPTKQSPPFSPVRQRQRAESYSKRLDRWEAYVAFWTRVLGGILLIGLGAAKLLFPTLITAQIPLPGAMIGTGFSLPMGRRSVSWTSSLLRGLATSLDSTNKRLH